MNCSEIRSPPRIDILLTATGRFKHSRVSHAPAKDRHRIHFASIHTRWVLAPVAISAKGAAATAKLGPELQASCKDHELRRLGEYQQLPDAESRVTQGVLSLIEAP